MKFKLGFLVTILTLIGMVIGGVCWFGNTQWVSKDKNEAEHTVITTRTVEIEKDVVEIKTDIKYIREGIIELKRRR